MLAAPHCRAEACQRLPQILVRDLRHAGSDTFGRNGIDRRGRPVHRPPQRRLPQDDPLNRTPAEEAVDTFADYIGQMLYLDRRRSFDPQDERAGRAP